jgi:hypothetical protein
MYVSYKKMPNKKIDTKIQRSKEADMPEPPKKVRLIQDSASRGTPSSSEEKKYQEPYYDETGRKARAGSKTCWLLRRSVIAKGELLGVMNPSSSEAALRAFDEMY